MLQMLQMLQMLHMLHMLHMLQMLQNVAKFQKIQLDNLVDFEKCCKTHIYLQRSAPIQPKTSVFFSKSCQKLATTLRVHYRVEVMSTPLGQKVAKSESTAARVIIAQAWNSDTSVSSDCAHLGHLPSVPLLHYFFSTNKSKHNTMRT